ncbi:TSC22 domain family protein 3 isoform X1 [Cuculus canorus]|uniref:TSC22 domain family protein 3 isoform X1 n=1 Tax=Cuculus canorus TaxID=55661 RepID=UPI0023AA26C0|nr:TSC22 domain family protein 3 isoform X1 [Cuculus canorus]
MGEWGLAVGRVGDTGRDSPVLCSASPAAQQLRTGQAGAGTGRMMGPSWGEALLPRAMLPLERSCFLASPHQICVSGHPRVPGRGSWAAQCPIQGACVLHCLRHCSPHSALGGRDAICSQQQPHCTGPQFPFRMMQFPSAHPWPFPQGRHMAAYLPGGAPQVFPCTGTLQPGARHLQHLWDQGIWSSLQHLAGDCALASTVAFLDAAPWRGLLQDLVQHQPPPWFAKNEPHGVHGSSRATAWVLSKVPAGPGPEGSDKRWSWQGSPGRMAKHGGSITCSRQCQPQRFGGPCLHPRVETRLLYVQVAVQVQ